MSYDFEHPFCSPVPNLSFQPSPSYAYFNAPLRDGYNPTYQPGDEPGHNGIDLNGPLGSPSVAAHDGVVMWAGPKVSNLSAGKFVEIMEEVPGGVWLTRYLHHDSVSVKAGDKVVRGDEIGKVGKTGQANTPHVHFEIRWNNLASAYRPGYGVSFGTKLDPMSFGILEDDCGEGPTSIWPEYLNPGDTNAEAVPVLASFLVALGYRGTARRSMNTYTATLVKQVKRFQRDAGLPRDGVVGPFTRDALYLAIGKTQ